MRYYDIKITDKDTGALVRAYTTIDPATGLTIPGALNVELDLPVVPLHMPQGAAFVRVWGISLQDIGQASDLNNQNISVAGGMSKGLPLANPQQAGILLEGTINQAFGNWVGTDMTLDLIIMTAAGSNTDPVPLVLNWPKGQTLSQALSATLSQAYPDFQQALSLSENLVLPQTETGYFSSMLQLALHIKNLTKTIIGGAYDGVNIFMNGDTITAYDGSAAPPGPTAIAFNDLIGQVTWQRSGTLNFKCVMRADLQVSDYITLPKGQVFTTSASYSQYRNGSAFQGTFQIDTVRHVGNFRSPDAGYWATVYDAHGPVDD